jgi:hypothetical protein
MKIVVKIVPTDHAKPLGKLADAELHFTAGELDGLKLIGFSSPKGANSPEDWWRPTTTKWSSGVRNCCKLPRFDRPR